MPEDDLEEFKRKISEYEKSRVEFSLHSETRIRQRNISKTKLRNKIFSLEDLEDAWKQKSEKEGEKYKLKYYESNKYFLVIVLALLEDKIKVVSFWKNFQTFEYLG